MLHNHTSSNPGHRWWLHVLICLAPVVAIAAIWLFQVPLSDVLLITLVLVCPLSHLLMMRHGSHTHQGAADDAAE